MSAFEAPLLLRSGHLQTVLGTTGRRWVMPKREADFLAREVPQDLTVPDGATLRVKCNAQDMPAPQVILIHGWLGCDHSSYVLSAAAALYRAGFSTVRINLRDHGDTEALNEGMYHSGLTTEVAELAQLLAARNGALPTGVIGFSLGGNFALRVARATGMPALAVCPAVDPVRTMHQIDHGSFVYKHYFLRKWQTALAAKQAAFPHLYDFSAAFGLRSVAALTDYFVRYHSPFENARSYFATYDLSGSALAGVRATILMAEDDPVIPASQFEGLPSGIEVHRAAGGGHGAFVHDLKLNSWCDGFAVRWAGATLPGASAA